MISPIGTAGTQRPLDLLRADSASRGEPAAKAAAGTEAAGITSPAAALAAQGAPIDGGKVAAIKQAIAEGRYPIDAKAIAASMIAHDLPA